MNLLEFTEFVRCSIVTDYFSFQHAVGAVGQAWLSKTFSVLGILSYLVSIMGSTTVRPGGNIFKTKVLRRLENVIFQIQYFVRQPFH